MFKTQIGIIGSAGLEEYPEGFIYPSRYLKTAEKMSYLLAKEDMIIFNGGKGGLMAAVAKGSTKAKGISIAIRKGVNRFSSNKENTIEIFTGMITGGSEYMLPLCCDIIISLGGGSGTLAEIVQAYRNKIPIIILKGFGGWSDKIDTFLDERKTSEIFFANNIEDVIRLAKYLKKQNKRCNYETYEC
jgi:uncharacterized protein (TIGR00725 family)